LAACTTNWELALEKPTLPVVADPVEVLHNCLVYKKQTLFSFPSSQLSDSLIFFLIQGDIAELKTLWVADEHS